MLGDCIKNLKMLDFSNFSNSFQNYPKIYANLNKRQIKLILYEGLIHDFFKLCYYF